MRGHAIPADPDSSLKRKEGAFIVAQGTVIIAVLAFISLPLGSMGANNTTSSYRINSSLLIGGLATATTARSMARFSTSTFNTDAMAPPIALGACAYTATPSPGDSNDSDSWNVSAKAPSRVPNPITSGCTVVIPTGPSSCLSKANATSGCAVNIPAGLTVVNYGTLEAGDYLGNNGTILNLGTIDIFHGSLVNGYVGTIANNGTLDCNCSFVNDGRTTNNGGGSVITSGGAVLENGGLITNNLGGVIVANDGGQVQNDGGLLVNAGNVTIDQGGEISDVNGGNLTNYKSGLVDNQGSLVNNDTLTNNGTMTNADGGTLTNSEGAVVENTGLLVNQGVIANEGTIMNAGEIDNSGTISARGL